MLSIFPEGSGYVVAPSKQNQSFFTYDDFIF